MEILVMWIVLCVLVGVWASSWGRNGIAWGIIAAVISPLIASIALAISGKTIEKKAEEAKLFKDYMKD